MANLTRRHRWKKWAPDIGENRELEGGPVLFLDIATDLTPAQLEEMKDKLTAPGLGAATRDDFVKKAADAFLDALGPFVRVHAGPHTVDGQPLATLADFFAIVQQSAGMGAPHLRELFAAVLSFNSVTGPDELFSLRPSGGERSTDAQRIAKAAPQPADP